MSDYTNYAQFNALTLTGRIFNAEIVQANGSEFLAVSIISTLMKDGPEVIVSFTNSNGLMSLHQKGFFGKGRQVTITGHIADVRSVYTDNSGQVRMLKRPEVKIVGATVLEGGLGPAPKKEATNNIVAGTIVSTGESNLQVDKTPSTEEVAF